MRSPLAVAFVLATAAPAAAQERAFEFQLKAAFLYKFGSFVEWPSGAFAGARSPVNLCVIGRDPFGASLDQLTVGQTVNMRPVVVRRLETISRSSGCHIAFLGGSPAQSPSAAARAVVGAPVLTVSDSPRDGGAIQFTVRSNRVRFRIDQRVAEQGGLAISSKLLSLAVEVAR